MWLLINNGVAVQAQEQDPAGRYHPSLQWLESDGEATVGWRWDGEKFTPPPEPKPATRTSLEHFWNLMDVDIRMDIANAGDPMIQFFLTNLLMKGVVDTQDPEVGDFVDYLAGESVMGKAIEDPILSHSQAENLLQLNPVAHNDG
jgi:hypothetical protein